MAREEGRYRNKRMIAFYVQKHSARRSIGGNLGESAVVAELRASEQRRRKRVSLCLLLRVRLCRF